MMTIMKCVLLQNVLQCVMSRLYVFVYLPVKHNVALSNSITVLGSFVAENLYYHYYYY